MKIFDVAVEKLNQLRRWKTFVWICFAFNLFACTAICVCVKLVEESCQKEWYRQMYLAMHKLTGESVCAAG